MFLLSAMAEVKSKSHCRISATDGKILPGLPSQEDIKGAILKIGEEEMEAIVKSFKHMFLLWYKHAIVVMYIIHEL